MKVNWWINLFKESYQSQGIKEVFRVLWSAVTNIGQNRMILFALTTPRPMADAIDAAKTHTFKFASGEEMEVLSRSPEYGIKDIDVERVRTGAIKCLLQMDEQNLVGYACVWGNQLAFITDGFHINLPDDTIYNYKGYTNPEYRGYGFQALRHLQLLNMLEQQGVKRLFGFVDHLNGKSLKGVRKSGYIPVGELKIKHKNGKASVKLCLEEHFWCNKTRL